jgi:hypothetical protein
MIPQELRIGNYVYWNGEPEKITSLSSMEPFVTNSNFDKCIEWDELEPIELTEEWLVKLGFELVETKKDTYTVSKFYKIQGEWVNKDVWYEVCSHSDCYNIASPWVFYKVYNGERICIFSASPFKDDYTVHELQNLYFALTGEELTIK